MSKKNKQRKVIVLVEDHPDIVRMYTTVFEALINADLFVAEDLKEGKRLVLEKNPDLLLIDLVIPVKKGDSFEPTSRHGFELLKLIRAEEGFEKLPVMVLTNLESMKDRETADEYNVIEYIIKSQTLPNQIAKHVGDFLGA